MVGHHVARQAQTAHPCPLAQVLIRCFPPEIGGNHIVVKRIGGSGGFRISGQLLDLPRSPAPLPYSDQPQRIKAESSQPLQLFIGYLVKASDRATVKRRKLVQPHVHTFGDQHRVWHPVRVGAESLVLVQGATEARDGCRAGITQHLRPTKMHPWRMKAHPDGNFLFLQHVHCGEQAFEEIAQQ